MNQSKVVDLLIIGAGATGSCIAYEATKRGLKVALLDAGDISSGTSCRSTKLLHGGVRYLELAFKTLNLGQLSLVREALIERHYWLQEVPFLAKKIELVLPTQGCLDKTYYRLGLGLYDALSGEQTLGSSRFVSKSQLNRVLPSLKDNLNGGVSYADGQFDDARLNLLLALTAEKSGAIIRTRHKVVRLLQGQDGIVHGAISENAEGRQEEWLASGIVNATGINVDKLRQMVDPATPPRILTSRGIHIVLEENLCPEGIGLLLPATEDGRVLFALPFFGHTQVGTTDTACAINAARKPSNEEEKYLMNYIQHWFPNRINASQIKSSWAGGRPLLQPTVKDMKSSQVVREHEIETLPCGLISAMGGKWTTCRRIALDTIKALEAFWGYSIESPRQLPIIGTANERHKTTEQLKQQEEILKSYLPKGELQGKQISHLQSSYGLEAYRIISKSSTEEILPLSHVIPICEAEIKHFIQNEHAQTATDILARRCRLAMIDFEEALKILPIVQRHLQDAKFNNEELDLEK